MQDEEIRALNAELAGLTGKARTMPLLRLGKAHAERHWRIGPGAPGGLPHLQASIEAFDEAHGYLPEGDPFRGQAALMSGVLRGNRLVAYSGAGPAEDRETGIRLIEEALGYPNIHPVLGCMGRIVLGQLYLDRVLRSLQSPDLLSTALRGSGMPASARADADRAVDCFRVVVDTSTVAEMTRAAQTMLTMAEVLQTVLSGFGSGAGLGGFDLSRMIEAVTKLQTIQQTGFRLRMPGAGLPTPPSALDFGTRPPESGRFDRPIVVLPGAEPARQDPTPAQEAPPPDVDAMRQDLRKLLPDGDDVFASISSLLRSDRTPDYVDEMVALATSVVYGADDAHSADEARGADHLLLAAALYLRCRRDADATAESASEAAPTQDAEAEPIIESLLAAARTVPRENPDAVPVLLHLAVQSAGAVPAALAAQLSELAAAVRDAEADALVFPDPAETLRLNAADTSIEAADAPATDGGCFVVIGRDALTRGDERATTAYSTLTRLIDRSRSRRGPQAISRRPVFLANPRGDREAAAAEVMLLRRTFYPLSEGFGRLIEDADGSGAEGEILDRLDCSMLHLACGVTESGALELADGAELDLACAGSNRGGLAILPPGCLQPLSDRLLALGFDDVIGWRRPVPEPIAGAMLYLLHVELVDNARSPAAAVACVRRGLRDPGRANWPQLPAGYAARLERVRAEHCTALVHLGG